MFGKLRGRPSHAGVRGVARRPGIADLAITTGVCLRPQQTASRGVEVERGIVERTTRLQARGRERRGATRRAGHQVEMRHVIEN